MHKPHLPVINGILWRLKTGHRGGTFERVRPWETLLGSIHPVMREYLETRPSGLQVKEDALGKHKDWDGASRQQREVAHRSAVAHRKQKPAGNKERCSSK
jgi:hypothetical protein